MGKILQISLKLTLTPNTLGCYGLIHTLFLNNKSIIPKISSTCRGFNTFSTRILSFRNETSVQTEPNLHSHNPTKKCLDTLTKRYQIPLQPTKRGAPVKQCIGNPPNSSTLRLPIASELFVRSWLDSNPPQRLVILFARRGGYLLASPT